MSLLYLILEKYFLAFYYEDFFKHTAKLKEYCSEYPYAYLDYSIIIWKGYLLEIEFQFAGYFFKVAFILTSSGWTSKSVINPNANSL